MSRLVVIRVGDQTDLWLISKMLGLWSSPESQPQVARDLLVEGFRVIALFVGRGDIPIAAARITGVRARVPEDSIFPVRTELGELRTFLQFDTSFLRLEVSPTITFNSTLEYVKYKIGSQVYVPPSVSRDFVSFFESMTAMAMAMAMAMAAPLASPEPMAAPYTGNTTFAIPQSSMNYII